MYKMIADGTQVAMTAKEEKELNSALKKFNIPENFKLDGELGSFGMNPKLTFQQATGIVNSKTDKPEEEKMKVLSQRYSSDLTPDNFNKDDIWTKILIMMTYSDEEQMPD